MSTHIEFHPTTAEAYEPIRLRLNLSRVLAGVRRSRNLLLLFLLALLWGSTSVTTKLGVASIQPFTFAFGRVFIGAVLLYAILRRQGGHLPGLGRYWLHLSFAALLHGAAPYLLLTWGLKYVDSAMASVMGGIAPLITILLAHFLIADDRLTAAKLSGVMIGFAGLFVLVAPAMGAEVQVSPGGLLAVGGANMLFGAAYVYTARFIRPGDGLAQATAQLLIASVLMLPVALAFDGRAAGESPTTLAFASLLITGVVGTGLPFLLFQNLKEKLTPTQLSLVSYIIPAVGVTLGVLVLGETVTRALFLGGGIILLGVMVVNGVFEPWLSWLHEKLTRIQSKQCVQPC